jgi:ferrous iron transport protein A
VNLYGQACGESVWAISGPANNEAPGRADESRAFWTKIFMFPGVSTRMKKVIRMREMSDKQKGIIKKISASGEMSRRIREMGLVPEVQIQIQGRAPLKDPVAVKLKDFTLTLRNNEASHILVEVEVADSSCSKIE